MSNNETEFTPGPWRIYVTSSDITVESNTIDICEIEWPNDEEVANAFLIAAAPDLYECLQQAVTWLEGCRDFEGDLSDFKKTLNRATGKESSNG